MSLRDTFRSVDCIRQPRLFGIIRVLELLVANKNMLCHIRVWSGRSLLIVSDTEQASRDRGGIWRRDGSFIHDMDGRRTDGISHGFGNANADTRTCRIVCDGWICCICIGTLLLDQKHRANRHKKTA
jgi:hypothetical protein